MTNISTDEEWEQGQRAVAEDLARRFHRIWRQVAPRYRPTLVVDWDDMPEVSLDERLAERDQRIDQLTAERDYLLGQNWAWYGRTMEAETERDQGAPLVRRIRCKAAAGKGAG